MIIVVSPAKTLNLEPLKAARIRQLAPERPQFANDAALLIDEMRQWPAARLRTLMSISEELAQLNEERFQAWDPEFPVHQSKPAVLTFDGDVYDGLQASTLSAVQMRWAQQHLRILSGLYGLLRPLDWMQAYRLEMGTRLPNTRGKDLYAFWGDRLAQELERMLDAQTVPKKGRILVNLASEEYFKAVDLRKMGYPVLTPVFLDTAAGGDGQYKVISFFAKRARGLMARFIIEQRLKSPEALKSFAVAGYSFDPERSEGLSWVFKRKTPVPA